MMNPYMNVIGIGFTWMLATWMFCKYQTDEKYMNHPLMKKLYPVCVACMVLSGSMFVHDVLHVWD